MVGVLTAWRRDITVRAPGNRWIVSAVVRVITAPVMSQFYSQKFFMFIAKRTNKKRL
jgi:hypothetical protein